MSGLDQILEHINQEAADAAAKIVDTARTEADRILSLEKSEAARLEAQISKQGEMDATAAAKQIRSAADLKEKRMLLEAKQAEIDSVLDEAQERLNNMEAGAYFATLEKMLARYATGKEGDICFNEKDLGRLPADFAQKAAAQNLKVSDKTVRIDGGFVLVYGDVEENCSFDALISASREDLQDKIGQILFS